jgi:hypothetical protein
MGWAAIIAALIRVLGPVLAGWVEDCTKERLEKAAAKLPAADTYASEGEAAAAVFDRAIKDLPRWAKWRRKALQRAKEVAVQGKKLRRAKLTAAEIAEGLDFVGAVKGE